ncbi:MAG: methionine adenosyltransferase [Candidatus Saccharimonadaceae bacterium]
MKHLFTSESVSEGHPDKLADQISDAILDAYLARDPNSKVACETLVTHKGIILAGEVHSQAKLGAEIEKTVRQVVSKTGYNGAASGYDAQNIQVDNMLHEQSAEIRKGVDEGGAGDQGMMFGYACNETRELMPLAIWLSHRIMERQAFVRKNSIIPWLLPDAKSQVTLQYENGRPVGIKTIVVSTQHMPGISQQTIRELVIKEIIEPVLPDIFRTQKIECLVNPSGSFEIGGPAADTGLTGRKIIVDTFGGSCPHGGGAFSGKDPSKVDRSAAYAARHIAKNLVAAGICSRASVQLSYAIGVARPTSLYVNTHGTSILPISDGKLSEIMEEIFTLTPKAIIERLKLKNPIYFETASYGHMGRENRIVSKSFTSESGEPILIESELFTWEKLDYTDIIRKNFKL